MRRYRLLSSDQSSFWQIHVYLIDDVLYSRLLHAPQDVYDLILPIKSMGNILIDLLLYVLRAFDTGSVAGMYIMTTQGL